MSTQDAEELAALLEAIEQAYGERPDDVDAVVTYEGGAGEHKLSFVIFVDPAGLELEARYRTYRLARTRSGKLSVSHFDSVRGKDGDTTVP